MNSEVVTKTNQNALPSVIPGAELRLVALAKIGRPYGLTGAMHVFPFSAEAATLRRAKQVSIRGRFHAVKTLKPHGEAYVMTLDGIESPEAAAAFTNAEIAVSRDLFPPLTKGEFYWVDLVGLECVNLEASRSFGKVVEVFEVGAHPLLRVRTVASASERDDELIPFVDAIIRSVDIEAKRIDVDWAGLHDAPAEPETVREPRAKQVAKRGPRQAG